MTWNADTADGIWKEVFGRLEDAVPAFATLQKRYEFDEEAALGKEFKFPVRVRRSHGVTLASGDNSLDAFTLNAPLTGQLKAANVSGSTCIIRERLSYKATMAAMSEGERAFAALYGEAVTDTFLSLHFYLESLMLYGQSDYGVIEAAGSSSAQLAHKITAATSAPGLWAQMEGAACDIWDPTFTTQRNTTGSMTVDKIDYTLGGADNGKVTVTLSGAAADNNNVQANDVIVPLGFYDGTDGHQTMAGIDTIVTNTGSLFGIDADTYPVWAGNTSAVGGALNFARLTKGQVAVAVRAGMSEDPLDVWISPLTWNDLNNDVAAVRRSAGNEGGRVEFGAKELCYYGVTGEMVIRPHALIKGGEAFAGMADYVIRGGVTKPTFEHPAKEGSSRFLREVEDNAGFEFRGMWDNLFVITKPRSWVKYTGITNGS